MSVFSVAEISSSWESVGLVTAMGTLVVGMGTVFLRMQKNYIDKASRETVETVRRESQHIQKTALVEAIKSNGVAPAFLDNLNIPAWFKDRDGVMKYINTSYSLTFAVTPQQYVGRTDIEVWPPEVARNFTRNDAEVVHRRVRVEFHEYIPRRDGKQTGGDDRWYVVKFPVIDPVSKEVMGVGGYCIPDILLRRASGKTGQWQSITEADHFGENATEDIHIEQIEGDT